MFEELVQQEEEQEESLFDDLAEEDVPPSKPALNSTTLVAALARIDPEKDPELQLGTDAIAEARQMLEFGQEKAMRYQVAGQRTERALAGLNRLRAGLHPMASPEDAAAVAQAYQNVLRTEYERKARVALEEQAFDNIQDMAARDPVQARIMLDNFEKGDANQTIRDFWTKMTILQQRSEELDQEWQQQGWGKAIFNFVLNLVPTNYNFARSGIVEPSDTGFLDWFRTGENLRKQSETMWNMSPEDFAEFAKPDGKLMQAIRENATTLFDMTADPRAAVEIIEALTAQSDFDRRSANVWGIIEPASVIPFGRITNVTKSLLSAGASRQAIANLDNAVRILDTEGPDAMRAATGVTEKELVEETAMTAINPARSPVSVPLAEQLETRMAAAEDALRQILDPPSGERFRTVEEIKAAYDDAVAHFEAQFGRPVKDVQFKVETLTGGASVRYVEVTFGKKDGHGFAREATARNAARRAGLGDVEAINILDDSVRNAGAYTLAEASSINKQVSSIVNDWVQAEGNLFRLTLDNVRDDLRRFFDVDVDGFLVGTNKIFKNEIEGPLSAWNAKVGKAGPSPVKPITKTVDEIEDETMKFWPANDGQLPDKVYDDLVEVFEAEIKELSEVERRSNTVLQRLWNEIREGQGYQDAFNAAASKARFSNPQNKLSEGGPPPPPPANDVEVFQEISGQWFAKARINVPEQGFFTNELHTPTQGFLSKLFGRFTRAAPRISDTDLHGRGIMAGSAINRAHKIIEKNLTSVFKKLDKQSYEAVRQIALKGANAERWYTPEEFNFLMQRGFGREATPKELDAYQKLILYNDMEWKLRNDMIYMDGVIRGKESVEMTTPWGQVIDEDVKINYAPDVVPRERVFNMTDGIHYTRQTNPLSSAELDRLRNNGYVLVEFPDGLDIPGGIIVNQVLVRRTDLVIKPLRKNQLAYTEGGHRMYVDKYFVKQGRKGTQSDTGTEYLRSPHTFTTAPNKVEASRWAAVMERARLLVKDHNASAQRLDDEVFLGSQSYPTGEEFLRKVEEKLINLDHPFEAVFNRELPSMYQKSGIDVSRFFNEDELGINGYYRTTGRLYTSSKGEHLKDHTGNLALTVDPYEALNTSLKQVTRTGGLFHYKTEALERFRNTYGKFLDIDSGWSNARILTEARVRTDVHADLRSAIEAQRNAILHVLRFETPADKLRNETYRSVAEWALGSGDNIARKWAHDAVWWWRDRSPTAFLRGLAFDSKLGMFNLGQLFIQTSTLISATALSPKYGMRGMLGLFPMHGYLLSRGSENVLDALTKRGVGRTMGFNTPEEFKEYARHAYASGFMDMNGSHIMINDFGPTAHFGSMGEKANSLREQARVFFYTAETWNRLVSYRIAWGEAMDMGLRVGDPKFNSTILKLADDYSMNMTSESAASWQKGLLSIPTQFWAYNVRMMDAMFGKRFTGPQRIRLMLANVGMAGSVGIPGLSALTMYLKDRNGESPDIDTLMGVADRGLVDYFHYQMSGADVMLGEKLGTGAWLPETLRALFGASEYGERSFADITGGATYSIGKSAFSAGYETLANVAAYSAAESGSDLGERAMAGDAFMKMLKEISTFGNATKAIMVQQYGIYKSKSGTILASDLPPVDSVYVALGFRPAPTEEIGHMMNYLENKEEVIKETATQLRNWRQEAFVNPDKFDENMQKSNVLIRLLPVEAQREVLRRTNSITEDSFYDYLSVKVEEERLKEGAPE